MTDPYASVDGLRVRLDGAVLRLTLDRPAKRNALDDVMVAGLIGAIDAAGRDERVRAIVLAGEGDHYCG
ncbi:MAG: enoyl-CoA hydratase-related protein, partial [Acidimicrobiales bacterium]